jgi:adenylate cyclase
MPFHKKLSLRFSILTLFITLLVATIMLILGLTTYTAENSMLTFSKRLMRQVASSISLDLSADLNPSQFASEFSSQLFSDNNLDPNDIEQVKQYTYHLLVSLPQAAKAYFGDENGNFIISRHEEDHSISSEVILRDQNKRIYTYRDLKGKVIDEKVVQGIDYDPRERSWYTMTKELNETVWSDVYIFHTGKFPFGVTSSSPVHQNGKFIGSFGVDVNITQISAFLEELPVSSLATLFIVNREGNLVASPNIESHIASSKELAHISQLESPWALKAYDRVKQKNEFEFSFEYDNKEYLAQFQVLPNFKRHEWLIGVIIPEKYFIGTIEEGYYYTLFYCLCILFAGVILISFIATKISQPLLKIVDEMKRVEDFDLSKTPTIESRITEVHYMGSAINSMKSGLRAFQMYVPQTLVRKLIKTGRGAKIGGEAKDLSILFTDIEDFTSIAETMNPQELMVQLCEYFDEMSKIITHHHGTIDKYIGDAIMAFWGAPLDDDKVSIHSCQAALACKDRLDLLNTKWKEENKPPFYTRLGIHRGVSLVGNLGSTERINYTAIGDAPNTASRLEGINKVYHTEIIVSEAIYQDVLGQCQMRLLDQIAVKGKTQGLRIYELIGLGIDETIERYNEHFLKAFTAYQKQDWVYAVMEFEKAADVWPEDDVYPIFIARCVYFKNNPPGDDWDGIWRYETK